MAFFFGDGFDLYSAPADLSSYWDAASTNLSSNQIVSPGRFTGTRAYSVQTGSLVLKTSGVNDAIHHFSVAVYQTTTISGATVYHYFTLYDAAQAQCTVLFRSDGAIILTQGPFNGTTLATYTGAVTAQNTWFQFEIEVRVSGTVGFMNVRKNGNTSNDFASATNLNTRGSSNDYANLLRFSANTASGNQYIDDFLWRSDASSVPWVGDIRCYTRMPASDVAVQWSPSSPTLPVLTIAFNSNSASQSTAARYSSFTPSINGSIGTVQMTAGAAYTGNIKCSIFSQVAASPGAILGSATPVTNMPTGTPTTFTFGTPVAVTAGTTYWVGFMTDTGVAGAYPQGAGTTGLTQNGATYAAFPTANPSCSASGAVVCTLNISPSGSPNRAMVQEPQQDGAVSYVYDSTVGHSDLYNIAPISATPGSIVGVTTRGYLQKSDAGTRIARLQLKSGATTVQSADAVLNTTWSWASRTDLTDPATGAAWTAVGVNNAQIGVVVQS